MVDTTAQDGKTESMEEILQSIKRIMDDDTETEPKPAKDTKDNDVFDLTNVVKDDGIMDEASAAAKSPQPPANSENTVQSVDSVFSGEHKPDAPAGEAGIISDQAASAAATSFRKIASAAPKDYSIPVVPSPELRSGNTVEDLMLEAIRPMLKEWLDKNLPLIVQKIVEKEIKRLVTLHYD